MPCVKPFLVAVMALLNVAVSSNVFSSELVPAVTSIQYMTSVTFVSAMASTSSNKACEVATVSEPMTMPNSTVSIPGQYGESIAMSTTTMNATKTVTMSSTRTVTRTSVKMNHTTTMTDGTATSMMSAPTLTLSSSHHSNASTTANTTASTTATVAETSGSAMLSATYATPNNSMPLFTAAADATNVGAVVLAGGVLMALGF
ncbi:uncharacterized protein yc1106_02811 [Curvularia clavata]|uniref:Uncharacterized protein n=1 Tax=Curvularia clavata TaxID=95742 RepID=A0A9Q8Z3G5_CURCL|nr:uncharacterized protein yc1106_02811 [Curvularia clavata]